jgi:hypothetical protein
MSTHPFRTFDLDQESVALDTGPPTCAAIHGAVSSATTSLNREDMESMGFRILCSSYFCIKVATTL